MRTDKCCAPARPTAALPCSAARCLALPLPPRRRRLAASGSRSGAELFRRAAPDADTAEQLSRRIDSLNKQEAAQSKGGPGGADAAKGAAGAGAAGAAGEHDDDDAAGLGYDEDDDDVMEEDDYYQGEVFDDDEGYDDDYGDGGDEAVY